MIDYSKILNAHYSDSLWILDGDDYAGLSWLSDSEKPTKKELDDLWPATKAKIVAEAEAKAASKAALLERLGITEDEAKLLLG